LLLSLSLSLSLSFLVAGTTLPCKCCCSKERSKRREEKRREQDTRGEHKTMQNRGKDVEERTYVLVV